MKKHKWRPYALWILTAEAAGALSGWVTRDGIRFFNEAVIRPPLSPPPWVFPVVWGLLFALMGIGAARVWLSAPSEPRSRGLSLFLVQLAVNFLWSVLFFNVRSYGGALVCLVVLWGLILGMLVSFRESDRTAGRLQLPYLLWVAFAGYLNAAVWLLNG